ncbi:MAG: LarC family nickel insertion protein [Desulfobacteraceae bacterium]|jgi:hypothetical protein|nr:LarC family nickel insertion protein [Desulfobacteraceae bacterium]
MAEERATRPDAGDRASPPANPPEGIRIAYLDCFAGISGASVLGALVDLGVPPDWLQGELGRMPLAGLEIGAREISAQGLRAARVSLAVSAANGAWRPADLRALIAASPFGPRVIARSLAIFDRLAAGRARARRGLREDRDLLWEEAVHLLVEIVGAALGLEYLKIGEVAASRIPLGGGLIQRGDEWLPTPAPETVEILHGVPVYGSGFNGELVTPTGAAIVSALADGFGAVPEMDLTGAGYGAGENRRAGLPNLLRILVGTRPGDRIEQLVMVATGIDDMNPELFGYLMEQLFADGALDVFWTPIYMKKNRPATQVQVLCHPWQREAVIRRLLSETTSTGVRCHLVERHSLFRETVRVETPFGPLAVKRILNPDGRERFTPEYEVCRKVAKRTATPLWRVYELVERAAAEGQAEPQRMVDKKPGDR